MRVFYRLVQSYWQIGFPVFAVFIFLELLKPGFILSSLNMNVLFVTMLAAFIADTIWGEDRVVRGLPRK